MLNMIVVTGVIWCCWLGNRKGIWHVKIKIAAAIPKRSHMGTKANLE